MDRCRENVERKRAEKIPGSCHDLTLIKERSDREENLRWESKQEVRRTEER
jgi:hypothetical protein